MTAQPEPPLARTFAEAELHLSYLPCRVCGLAALEVRGFSYETVGGFELDQIETACLNCGDVDEHPYRLPMLQAESKGGHLRYGGPEPSELLDPGDWLLLASALLADVPQEHLAAVPVDQRTAYRNLVDAAVSAVEEALKFLDDGAATIARDAFWSNAGYELFVRSPELFRRERLNDQLRHHQDLLRRYEGLSGSSPTR
jgi:hypothetical protein